MSAAGIAVKPGSVAPLKNVAACMTLIDALTAAPLHLPSIGVFSGFSGYGKTMAAQYAWNRTGAVFVEVREYWARSTFCKALLAELGGGKPRATIPDMMEEIIARLAERPRLPVIIDQADVLIDKGMIELVRDLHDTARVPILLVGEEALPAKLSTHERVHNRVLDWALAQPCDLEDARSLAGFLYPSLRITDGWLERVRAATEGRARRIATTLHEAAAWAAARGVTSLDEASYDGRIFDGAAPTRYGRSAG